MDDYKGITSETYLSERLEQTIKSSDRKARFHRAWFIVFKVIQIITLALIPILATLPIPCFKLLAVIIASLVLVLEALIALSSHKDKWQLYQETSKTLASEKFAFETKAGIYQEKSDDERFSFLVDRCEVIIKYRN